MSEQTKLVSDIADIYQKQYQEHGCSPKSLFNPKFRQPWRFANLIRGLEFSSVLDFGCGLSYFRDYLNENGRSEVKYTGVDIVEEFVKSSQEKYPEDSFHVDPFLEKVEGKYDLILISGTFNILPSGSNVEAQRDFIYTTLQKLSQFSSGVIVFDFLNEFADFYAPEAFWMNIHDVVAHVSKNISPRFEIFQHYMKYETGMRIYTDLSTNEKHCYTSNID